MSASVGVGVGVGIGVGKYVGTGSGIGVGFMGQYCCLGSVEVLRGVVEWLTL